MKYRRSYGKSDSQYGELYMPEGKGPWSLIVSIHGGFWKHQYDLSENEKIAEDLSHRQYAVWNIEYRRTGEDGGGWPGTFLDVVDAINYIAELKKEFNLHTSDGLTLIGHSAGGHLALWLASRVKVTNGQTNLFFSINKVISLAGVTDLERMADIHEAMGTRSPVFDLIGEKTDGYTDRLNKVSPSHLLPIDIDQVLIHGDQDKQVPIALSQAYFERAKRLGEAIKFVKLSGADHFDVTNPQTEAWKSVVALLS